MRSAHVVDDSQTVINVKGRRSRKKRDRERERGGAVLHNCSCCAQCEAPANRTDFYRHAGHIISQ